MNYVIQLHTIDRNYVDRSKCIELSLISTHSALPSGKILDQQNDNTQEFFILLRPMRNRPSGTSKKKTKAMHAMFHGSTNNA
jgi:hypothetical protein